MIWKYNYMNTRPDFGKLPDRYVNKRLLRSAIILILCLCLLPCAGSGTEEDILFTGTGFLVRLVSCQSENGNVRLELSLENSGTAECLFGVVSPCIEGESAWTAEPKGREMIPVPPQGQKQVEIILQGDRDFDEPEEVSFFIHLDDKITSRTVIHPGGAIAEPASEATERQAVSPQIAWEGDPHISCKTLRDQCPDISEKPEVTTAMVCLREGDLLRLLATLPAEVSETGEATAKYSNLALALNPEDPFPITCTETTTDIGTVWTTDRIGLYSDSIYFAVLTLTGRGEPEQLPRMEYRLEAEEFGTVSLAPYDFFQGGTALSLMYRMENAEPEFAGSVPAQLTMDGPLRFVLLQASELGDIVYFFRYEYRDGSCISHMPDAAGFSE